MGSLLSTNCNDQCNLRLVELWTTTRYASIRAELGGSNTFNRYANIMPLAWVRNRSYSSHHCISFFAQRSLNLARLARGEPNMPARYAKAYKPNGIPPDNSPVRTDGITRKKYYTTQAASTNLLCGCKKLRLLAYERVWANLSDVRRGKCW